MNDIKSKGFTKEEKEVFNKSREMFYDAMTRHDVDTRGQVIAINFKTKKIVNSKCENGVKIKVAA